MPRDGSGVYSKASASFVAGTTISSSSVNADFDDLVSDANSARPITAGGTGATTIIGAFDAFQTHGVDIATAATLVLDSATGEMIDLTGTTSVTAVTLASGKRREARAVGAFTLTASTTLIVNGSTGTSYTTKADDLLQFEGYASSIVRVWVTARAGGSPLPAGFLFGLTLSNNVTDATNDIDIAAGSARDSTDVDNMVRAAAITKQLDVAWAVGTNQGGRMSAAAIADTTYHVFLIKRVDTGVVDIGFDVSATAPTMPANYTLFRRIGSITRVASSIGPFLQKGDVFYRGAPTRDTSAVNPGAAAVTRAVSVPTGISVTAMLQGGGNGGSNAWTGILSSLEVADITPTGTAFNISVPSPTTVSQVFTRVDVSTDTSAQIRTRISPSGALDVLQIVTLGWVDTRGRT